MGAENYPGAGRDFVEIIHEKSPFAPEVFNDAAIVHNFLADINRRPAGFERFLDDVDGAHHPGAETSQLGDDQSSCGHLTCNLLAVRAGGGRLEPSGDLGRDFIRR